MKVSVVPGNFERCSRDYDRVCAELVRNLLTTGAHPPSIASAR